jgi:PilZ domain
MSDRDRRIFPRYQVRKDGRLLFVDKPCCVECTIKDISEDGALLTLQVAVALPPLVLLWEQGTGAMHECQVRWRKGDIVGVHFTDMAGRRERRSALERPIAALKHLPRHRSSLH